MKHGTSAYHPSVTVLAEVLEAIYTSRRRFRTVRAGGLLSDRTWRMWWAGSEHIRTEEERDDGMCVIVQAGDRWWIREPRGKGHANEGDPNVRVGFGPGARAPPSPAPAGVDIARVPTGGNDRRPSRRHPSSVAAPRRTFRQVVGFR